MSDEGRVVVGFDGSPDSETALRYAVGEAARRQGSVRVVTAYEPPDTWAVAYGVALLPDAGEARRKVQEHVHAQVTEVVKGFEPALRAVPVETIALTGPPTVVLVDQARDAGLLVVGHRGRGGVRSVLLGSVGLGVVLRAPCPVTVVPMGERADDSDGEVTLDRDAAPTPVGPLA